MPFLSAPRDYESNRSIACQITGIAEGVVMAHNNKYLLVRQGDHQ